MELEKIKSLLIDAEKNVTPLAEPFSKNDPNLDLDKAYKVQLMIKDEKLKSGQKIVGKKIGFTSKAMKELFGIDEPDYGHLFDDMLISQGSICSMNNLIEPKVEGEIAFILKKDLVGPGVTITDVYQATEGVTAAIEIVDSRIKDWNIKFEDSVADNGSSKGFIIGSNLVNLSDIDLRHLGMFMEKNGELVNSGTGIEVLGNPAYSVAWLANKLSEFDIILKSGEIILSGAITAAIPVSKGDVVNVSFDKLGNISAKFE